MSSDSRKIAGPRRGELPRDSADQNSFLARRRGFVQRVLKMRRRFGELPPDLIDVLLVALLDLFLEELLQRAVAQAFLVASAGSR